MLTGVQREMTTRSPFLAPPLIESIRRIGTVCGRSSSDQLVEKRVDVISFFVLYGKENGIPSLILGQVVLELGNAFPFEIVTIMLVQVTALLATSRQIASTHASIQGLITLLAATTAFFVLITSSTLVKIAEAFAISTRGVRRTVDKVALVKLDTSCRPAHVEHKREKLIVIEERQNRHSPTMT